MPALSFPTQNNRIIFKHKEVCGLVSIIIPVYNDIEGLVRTLSSLIKQSALTSEYEVIVINDGSNPRISDSCRKFGVLEVKINQQRGSYFARNKGIEASRGEFLLFTDADLTLPIDWIARYKDSFSKGIDFIGGEVIIDKKKIFDAVNYIDFLFGFPVKAAFSELNFIPTANLAVRRRITEKLGGFDNRLLSAGDYEFGNRVKYFSTFKQGLIQNTVTHPPRQYRSFVRKLKRVSHGLRILFLIYPTRFPNLNIDIFNELRRCLYFPQVKKPSINKISRVKIFYFLTIFQCVKCYYNIWFKLSIRDERYKGNESFFNSDLPW